jgi:hypothetical protein
LSRGPGDLAAFLLSIVARVGDAELGQDELAGAEGVGLDDIGTGREVVSWISWMTSGRVATRMSVQFSQPQ